MDFNKSLLHDVINHDVSSSRHIDPSSREPGSLVLVLVALEVDGRGLGVTANFREARFFDGDSPLMPRASKMSTRGFASEGTKMLVDELTSENT
jgi:hypothetical protein